MSATVTLTTFNYQAVCLNCKWHGKVYTVKHRAIGSADVHNMCWHAGETNIINIAETDAPVTGAIEAHAGLRHNKGH